MVKRTAQRASSGSRPRVPLKSSWCMTRNSLRQKKSCLQRSEGTLLGQAFGLVVKMLVSMSAAHVRIPGFHPQLWLLTQASC